MLQGAGEVTQCCESETINTPMTKRPFYEYSEPASPPWEANMLVPFSFLLLETREALPVNGDWQLSGFAFCMQQIPHLHHLYTPSCKVAHPFPHFTKEIRASFGNTSQNLLFMPSSKDLDLMQMNSVLIFLISLFKRQCNICSACSSCLGHGWLSLWPPVQLPCSWCVGQGCAHTLASPEASAGCGAPLAMPGGAAGPWVPSPPDVHQGSPSPSAAAAPQGHDGVQGLESPLGCRCALRTSKSSIAF